MSDSLILTPDEATKLTPLFYHKADAALMARMEALRVAYLTLAATIIRTTPYNRSQARALTYLEDSAMRAIQALALEGEMSLPSGVEVHTP